MRLVRWLLRYVACLSGLLLFAESVACATPEPSGGVVAANVLYADNFSVVERGPWQLEGDDKGRASIIDDFLLLEVNAANTVQYTTLAEHTFSNFSLEVDVTQLAGGLNSTYGVLFRLADPPQFYRYDITGNGEYVLERRDADGSWTRLSDGWVPSSALQPGLNVTNRLGVIAVGGTYSLYANGELVAQLSDGRYGEGSVALDAGTFAQAGLQVAFDNLVIGRP